MERFFIQKMVVKPEIPVLYTLMGVNGSILINEAVGKKVSIKHTGQIRCQWCQKITPKSYAQGYCYQCFISCPETEPCILKPDLCQIQWGKARDIQWAVEHHLEPHIVYLAYTGNVKVGVTRKSQVPTRWIDQGATIAIPVFEVPNRFIAGLIEKYLMKYYSDKTNWSEMLTTNTVNYDLFAESERVISLIHPEFRQYEITDREPYYIHYPLMHNPRKPVQVALESQPVVLKQLIGIKGQYLIFDDNSVLNIRKYGGYEIELDF